jgi:hypothetical protein
VFGALALAAAVTAPVAAAESPVEPDRIVVEMRTGVRLGYAFVNLQPDDPLRSPHLSVFGVEVQQRFRGGDWLDFIVVENLSVTGIEQGLFRPSLNLLLGFEFRQRLQIGAGAHIQPLETDEQALRLQLVIGGTVPAGELEVPIHLGFIPDPDGRWRAQLTTGVFF